MYSKEPVQQVRGFLSWKMHARVAYHFNSITHKNPTDNSVFTSLNPVNIYYCCITSNETSY